MRIRNLLLLVLACFIGNACTTRPNDHYTLYLVRHAEKLASGGNDPALSAAGMDRAEQLATWLQDKNLRDIWSSDYRRSRDTAAPLVARLGLTLTLYDPRDLPALARDLVENRHNALVVGHSNTTPELASLLCECFIDDMDDSEYERLIVSSFSGGEVRVETLTQNTLLPAPASS
ncbi:MAG TPA: phosphoglycerate mutase family protein [Xanthomonadales bacterium]